MKILTSILLLSFVSLTNISIGQIPDSIPGIPQPLQDQGEINGKIVDSKTNKPVEFASVALIHEALKQTVKAVQTDLQGNLKISNVSYGRYTIKISFVGYTPFFDTLIISAQNREVNLGTIKLVPGKANVLKEVIVQGQRSAIQLGIDRKIFSVDQSLVSQGGSATDLLANVPTVSVDIDGNVSLRGTDNVRVLIDGKASAIGGGNIAQILQSLPASSIETIELITNPSSKYDAEGQTGIINIVLKKNQKIGINGSIALTAGNLNNYNASTNLSFRNSKLNLYGNYSFRNGNRQGEGFNNTTYLNSNGIVNNNSDSRRQNVSNSAKLGADYYFNDKTTLGVSGNFSFRNNESRELLNYLYQGIPQQNGTSFRTTDGEEDDVGYDLSFDFSKKLKRKGEELTANFSFGQDAEDGIQYFNQSFFNTDGTTKDTVDRRITDNSELSDSYNIQLDYILPLTTKQKLELGYRSTIRKDKESQISNMFNPTYNDFVMDYGLSNDFLLDDIVHAAYTTYQNQLTDKFGFQVGLRVEQAYLNTEYKGIDSLTSDKTSVKGELDYLRAYPSVFLTQKLRGNQQLQLSYSRRVNRPRGWQVNPFINVSDQNNIRVGNPNLRPEDIHSFELSYIKYWEALTFTSSAYFRQVNDVVQRVSNAVDGQNATTITQFFNLTRSRATGLELISKADITKGFNLTGNVNLFYNEFSGNKQFDINSGNGINWNANLTSNLQFPKNLSAQLNMNYTAPRINPQGRSREIYGMDIGLRKDILKNKAGSISLNIRDIFNSRKFGQTTETAVFIQDSERRMQGRMANLTFSYRFGKQDIKERNRKKNTDEPRIEEEPL